MLHRIAETQQKLSSCDLFLFAYLIAHYNTNFNQDYNLVYHTIHDVWFNIIHEWPTIFRRARTT